MIFWNQHIGRTTNVDCLGQVVGQCSNLILDAKDGVFLWQTFCSVCCKNVHNFYLCQQTIDQECSVSFYKVEMATLLDESVYQ